MPDAVQGILKNWSLPAWLTLSVILTGLIYARGYLAIRKTRPALFTGARLVSFLVGLLILWLALGPPMDDLADALLSAHMVEHLLLMSAVPPLLLYGLPIVPMLRGLPAPFRRHIVSPLLRLSYLRAFGKWIVNPVVAWIALNATFLLWHIPAAYDFALRNQGWHVVEHLCFLMTAILFWWCILRPWPARANGTNWGILIYLIAADLVNTLLSAFLAFCNRPVYSYYADRLNSFGVSPLEDQVLGAVIMWVIGSLAYLIPAAAITVRLLSPSRLLRNVDEG
jgi:cytochrome c oxidase assembly factor CtaG